MQILITFKRSEAWLYNEIQRHSNKSGFVKDAVVEHLEKNKTGPNDVGPAEREESAQ